jgi:predicted metal-dependent phosphoesterase TrpH
MPGFEPFLLCDFHVHTRWSDGTLSIREVCDLYGQTGHVDVIAITDHILMAGDMLGRAARAASLGRRHFSVQREHFAAYLEEIAEEGRRAMAKYGLLVIPGAEVTQNHLRATRNSHIIGLGIHEWISADQSAEAILLDIRRQGGLSIACHPQHRSTRRLEISTCHLWDNRASLAHLIDVWEAANRDDLFPVTSEAAYPYVANSDFHRPRHLYSWKTLLKARKDWPSIAAALRANVGVGVFLYRQQLRESQAASPGVTQAWAEPQASTPAADGTRAALVGVTV